MAQDAVADLAEPGEIDEEPFLEEGGIGLSRYADLAKSQSFSMISGASGADTKKFGTRPNRRATSRSKLEFMDGDGIFDGVGIFSPRARFARYSSSAAIARDRPLKDLIGGGSWREWSAILSPAKGKSTRCLPAARARSRRAMSHPTLNRRPVQDLRTDSRLTFAYLRGHRQQCCCILPGSQSALVDSRLVSRDAANYGLLDEDDCFPRGDPCRDRAKNCRQQMGQWLLRRLRGADSFRASNMTASPTGSRRPLRPPYEAARDFCSMLWRRSDTTTTFQRSH